MLFERKMFGIRSVAVSLPLSLLSCVVFGANLTVTLLFLYLASIFKKEKMIETNERMLSRQCLTHIVFYSY